MRDQAERNRQSIARKKERGLVRVETWVPADKRERLLKYAEGLRKKSG